MAKAAPERISWAVATLSVEPTDRLLEIGCGTGVAVSLVCDQLADGMIVGLDRSQQAIDRATKRNLDHVAAGSAQFQRSAFEDADLPPSHFDKIFAINVNLFWVRTSSHELDRIRTALKSGGSLYLFYEPPSATKAESLADQISVALADAGYATRTFTAETSNGAALLCLRAQPAVDTPVAGCVESRPTPPR